MTFKQFFYEYYLYITFQWNKFNKVQGGKENENKKEV